MRTDSQVIRLLYVQLLERIWRLDDFLKRAEAQEGSERQVVLVFMERLADARQALRESMPWVAYIDRFDSEEAKRTSLMALSRCFNTIDELHLHLGYTQGRWVSPQARIFVSALFEPIWANLGEAISPSIVPSDTYMFEETDLGRYLAAKTGGAAASKAPTLFLPKIEADNPLMWASLVHEMGHALREHMNVDEFNIAELTKGRSTTGREACENWLEEVFCDLLSLHLLGPAYLASFLEFLLVLGSRRFLEAASGTHPYPRLRIVVMSKVLSNAGIVSEFEEPLLGCNDLTDLMWTLFEERCSLSRLLLRRRASAAPVAATGGPNIDAREFQKQLEARVDSLFPFPETLREFDSDKFALLSKRMADGIPIGSYSPGQLRGECENALTALREIDETIAIADRGELLNKMNLALQRVQDSPCSIAEIVNAGWLHKCNTIYRDGMKRIELWGDDDDEWLRERLRSLDELMRSSIESSYLHSIYEGKSTGPDNVTSE